MEKIKMGNIQRYFFPKHNIVMSVLYEEFNILGNIYKTKVAACPKCKNFYVGKCLIINAPTFTIKNKSYQYLACLDESSDIDNSGFLFTSAPTSVNIENKKECVKMKKLL